MIAAQPPGLWLNPTTQLINELARIVGPQNIRALFVPDPSDGPISQDRAVPSRAWTHSVLPAYARYARLGKGWMLSFDGSTQFLTTPDLDDLSFGNSLVDTPFSVFTVLNTPSSAANRNVLAKWRDVATISREWIFWVDGANKLNLWLADESTATSPLAVSNAAVNLGVPVSLCATYSGVGGAVAANGMSFFQNGVAFALTPTNAGAYVAMENGASFGSIGATATGNNPYLGLLGVTLLAAVALTSAQAADLSNLVQRFYGF